MHEQLQQELDYLQGESKQAETAVPLIGCFKRQFIPLFFFSLIFWQLYVYVA